MFAMSASRLTFRFLRPGVFSRPLSTSSRWSAIPSRPSEQLNAENTQRTSDGLQKDASDSVSHVDLEVGEMEGGKFKIEPLRRTGEDANTMRARLLYQSRKRGTLESDLLMSTFADAHLPNMTMAEMSQYDLFLDENDWDIYYWATQEPSPSAESVNALQGNNTGSPAAQGTDPGKQTGPELETDHWRQGKARSGEWAQTVGTFKPAYRPVPARWKNSEILAKLRRHVIERSAGGIHQVGSNAGEVALSHGAGSTRGGGMAFMPEVRNMDT